MVARRSILTSRPRPREPKEMPRDLRQGATRLWTWSFLLTAASLFFGGISLMVVALFSAVPFRRFIFIAGVGLGLAPVIKAFATVHPDLSQSKYCEHFLPWLSHMGPGYRRSRSDRRPGKAVGLGGRG